MIARATDKVNLAAGARHGEQVEAVTRALELGIDYFDARA